MRDYQTKANQGALPDSITAEKLGAGEANSTLTESKTAVSSSGYWAHKYNKGKILCYFGGADYQASCSRSHF